VALTVAVADCGNVAECALQTTSWDAINVCKLCSTRRSKSGKPVVARLRRPVLDLGEWRPLAPCGVWLGRSGGSAPNRLTAVA
jgi:hypothetical protein